MSAITDFKAWLDQEDIQSAEDMLQIYRPVTNNEKGWMYEVKPAKGNKGGVIIEGGEEPLLLTEKSRTAFVKYMDSLYETGVECQAAFEYAISQND